MFPRVRVVPAAALLALAALVATLLPGPAQAQRAFQVVNGQPAEPGEWPSFTFVSTDDGEGAFLSCGGSLVAPRWVLTAAHCVYDERAETNFPPPQVRVSVGEYDLSVPDGEPHAVDRIAVHPAYDPLVPVNDLALLRLTEPSGIAPQRLIARGEEALYPPGSSATVYGHGAVTPQGDAFPVVLQEGVLPIEDDSTCQSQGFANLDPARHLCAGARGDSAATPGNSACFGDSGGPLVVPHPSGSFAQIGLVSFGPSECGVQRPGVFSEIAQYRVWIDATVDGSLTPGQPDPDNPGGVGPGPTGPPEPVRVSDGGGVTLPVEQAVQDSLVAFDPGGALWGVLARGDLFADALGGSSLAFGFGPLLFTNPDGTISPAALTEFRRTVPRGEIIYLLGGTAAIPPTADQILAAEGFRPVRLAGPTREHTANLVAREAAANFASLASSDPGEAPFGTVLVATAGNWPDAVAAGQVGSWFGIPIVLTSPSTLGAPARDFIEAFHRPGLLGGGSPLQVAVVGGEGVVSAAAMDQITAIVGRDRVVRLGGPTRTATSAAVLDYTRGLHALLEGVPPDLAVTVNLRRADAFAHVLSASMLTGRFAGVFVPVEGENGERLTADVRDAVCGTGFRQIVQGGPDLVADTTVATVQNVLQGLDCIPPLTGPGTEGPPRAPMTLIERAVSAAPVTWSGLATQRARAQ